jgi:hypothetical protein
LVWPRPRRRPARRRAGKQFGHQSTQRRARFLALAEYCPRSIIYHEGNRFHVARALLARQDADRELVTGDDRRAMLFYEAAENGAAVLSRLTDESGALAKVARKALEICHFDPDTGEDKGQTTGGPVTEPCIIACYACLLSYSNQREQNDLDRHAAKPVLMQLAAGTGPAGGETRAERYNRLLAQCDSERRRAFLRYLFDGGYRLPDTAQAAVNGARPDFLNEGDQLCVYVDGPIHDFPDRAARRRDTAEPRAARLRDRRGAGRGELGVGGGAVWVGVWGGEEVKREGVKRETSGVKREGGEREVWCGV